MIYCSRCGTPHGDTVRVCDGCGARLATPDRRKRALRGSLVALAILDFLGAGLLLAVLGVGQLLFGPFLAVRRVPGPLLFWASAALAVLVLLHGAAGLGLLMFRRWGKWLHLLVSAVWLFAFPVGTVLGAASWIYLLRPKVDAIFLGRATERG